MNARMEDGGGREDLIFAPSSLFHLPSSAFFPQWTDLDPFQFFRCIGCLGGDYLMRLWYAQYALWMDDLFGGGGQVCYDMRRYVISHALRRRFRRFWGFIICILLWRGVWFVWAVHGVIGAE